MIQYFITSNNCTVFINNKPIMIKSDHVSYEALKECLQRGCQDEAYIMSLFDVKNLFMKECGSYVQEIGEHIATRSNKDFYIENIIPYALKRNKKMNDLIGFVIFLDDLSKFEKKEFAMDVLEYVKKNKYYLNNTGELVGYATVSTSEKYITLWNEYRAERSIVKCRVGNIISLNETGGGYCEGIDVSEWKVLVDSDNAAAANIIDFCNECDGTDFLVCL